MKRGNFFKALVGLAIAPKAIIEVAESISVSTPLVSASIPSLPSSNFCLISDLNALAPHYWKSYMEKYGDGKFVESVSEHFKSLNNDT